MNWPLHNEALPTQCAHPPGEIGLGTTRSFRSRTMLAAEQMVAVVPLPSFGRYPNQSTAIGQLLAMANVVKLTFRHQNVPSQVHDGGHVVAGQRHLDALGNITDANPYAPSHVGKPQLLPTMSNLEPKVPAQTADLHLRLGTLREQIRKADVQFVPRRELNIVQACLAHYSTQLHEQSSVSTIDFNGMTG